LLQIIWLEETICQQIHLVGGKAANLAKLANQFRVPPGFVIPQPSVPQSVIRDAYQRLGDLIGEAQLAVAVRSSATDEDSAAAAFAGQYESYLNIIGADAVCDAVELCWRSASAERVVEYRRQHGLATQAHHLAVLVQALVPADVSAVVFSANPVTQSRQEIIVNASWGLGESIVGGTVTPDTFVVKADHTLRHPTQIITSQIADKTTMTVRSANGTQAVRVPTLLRTRPSIQAEEVLEMAQLALDLQATLGYPVDVECAYATGKLYLLQCRPITTLAAA
jgi:pyruvate,water dikinase